MRMKPAIVPSTFLRHLGPIVIAMLVADALMFVGKWLAMLGQH